MTDALKLNNLRCEIDDRVLFSGLSAQFESGDLVQIVGPNGAGKTTLLRIITGISHRYEGEMHWGENGEYAVPSYEYYSSLLYIGHSTGVKSSLSPVENLAWYFGLNGVKSQSLALPSHGQLLDALEQVGLAGYEDVPSYQMSAGQQRRVALARLYLSEAPLWILDEPFTAIDKQGVANLENLIQNHQQRGGIVILTSHQTLRSEQLKIVDLADYADASYTAEAFGGGK